MTHPMHQPVVDVINQAIGLMDDFMRLNIDEVEYAQKLKEIDVDTLLTAFTAHKKDFQREPKLVYYLDALMMLSSLQHQLDFQIAEYGANVASEDIKCLRDILDKLPT
jgi:hypothetical protein